MKIKKSEQFSVRVPVEIMRGFDSVHSRNELRSFIRAAIVEKLQSEGAKIDMARANPLRGSHNVKISADVANFIAKKINSPVSDWMKKAIAEKFERDFGEKMLAARARHADDKSAIA